MMVPAGATSLQSLATAASSWAGEQPTGTAVLNHHAHAVGVVVEVAPALVGPAAEAVVVDVVLDVDLGDHPAREGRVVGVDAVVGVGGLLVGGIAAAVAVVFPHHAGAGAEAVAIGVEPALVAQRGVAVVVFAVVDVALHDGGVREDVVAVRAAVARAVGLILAGVAAVVAHVLRDGVDAVGVLVVVEVALVHAAEAVVVDAVLDVGEHDDAAGEGLVVGVDAVVRVEGLALRERTGAVAVEILAHGERAEAVLVGVEPALVAQAGVAVVVFAVVDVALHDGRVREDVDPRVVAVVRGERLVRVGALAVAVVLPVGGDAEGVAVGVRPALVAAGRVAVAVEPVVDVGQHDRRVREDGRAHARGVVAVERLEATDRSLRQRLTVGVLAQVVGVGALVDDDVHAPGVEVVVVVALLAAQAVVVEAVADVAHADRLAREDVRVAVEAVVRGGGLVVGRQTLAVVVGVGDDRGVADGIAVGVLEALVAAVAVAVDAIVHVARDERGVGADAVVAVVAVRHWRGAGGEAVGVGIGVVERRVAVVAVGLRVTRDGVLGEPVAVGVGVVDEPHLLDDRGDVELGVELEPVLHVAARAVVDVPGGLRAVEHDRALPLAGRAAVLRLPFRGLDDVVAAGVVPAPEVQIDLGSHAERRGVEVDPVPDRVLPTGGLGGDRARRGVARDVGSPPDEVGRDVGFGGLCRHRERAAEPRGGAGRARIDREVDGDVDHIGARRQREHDQIAAVAGTIGVAGHIADQAPERGDRPRHAIGRAGAGPPRPQHVGLLDQDGNDHVRAAARGIDRDRVAGIGKTGAVGDELDDAHLDVGARHVDHGAVADRCFIAGDREWTRAEVFAAEGLPDGVGQAVRRGGEAGVGHPDVAGDVLLELHLPERATVVEAAVPLAVRVRERLHAHLIRARVDVRLHGVARVERSGGAVRRRGRVGDRQRGGGEGHGDRGGVTAHVWHPVLTTVESPILAPRATHGHTRLRG
jgi:hypothetical protein